jgi:microsomal dipeptidase-like Zn-dependent dipeptidase
MFWFFLLRGLAKRLVELGVWIDLSHASEKTFSELWPFLLKSKQPPLVTHAGLRLYKNTERALSTAQLKLLGEKGGLLGLATAESVIGQTVVASKHCPSFCKQGCSGGVFALATQFDLAARFLGKTNVFLASDFNGAMDQLKPHSCRLGSTLDQIGFANISQTAELW